MKHPIGTVLRQLSHTPAVRWKLSLHHRRLLVLQSSLNTNYIDHVRASYSSKMADKDVMESLDSKPDIKEKIEIKDLSSKSAGPVTIDGVTVSTGVPQNPDMLSVKSKGKNKKKKAKYLQQKAEAESLLEERTRPKEVADKWVTEEVTGRKGKNSNSSARQKEYLSEISEGDFQYTSTRKNKKQAKKDEEHIARMLNEFSKYQEEEFGNVVGFEKRPKSKQSATRGQRKNEQFPKTKKKEFYSETDDFSEEGAFGTPHQQNYRMRGSAASGGSYSKLLQNIGGARGFHSTPQVTGQDKDMKPKVVKAKDRKKALACGVTGNINDMPLANNATSQQTTTTAVSEFPLQPNSKFDETEVRVEIQKEEKPFILGPNNVNLDKIYQLTGVRVLFLPPEEQQCDLESIVLLGHKLQVGSALSMLFSQSYEFQRAAHQHKQQSRVQPPPRDTVSQKFVKSGYERHQDLWHSSFSEDQGHSGFSAALQHGERNTTVHQPRNAQLPQSATLSKSSRPQQIEAFSGKDGKLLHNKHHGQKPSRQVAEVKGHKVQGQSVVPVVSRGKDQGQKNFFEPYMSREELINGVSEGSLIKGQVRINQKNFQEAFVPDPTGKDIFLQQLSDRNRALNGDIVAVKLNDKNKWILTQKVFKELKKANVMPELVEKLDDDPDVIIESEEIVTMVPEDTAEGIASEVDKLTIATETADDKSQTKASRYLTLESVFEQLNDAAKELLADENSPEAQKLLLKTGKVVGILERKHHSSCSGFLSPCTGNLKQLHNESAFFTPRDWRFPRLLIPIKDCPADFQARPEDYKDTLFAARLVVWNAKYVYGSGRLEKVIGKSGEIETETESHLVDNNIDSREFPDRVLSSLPQKLPWEIPKQEIANRRDFRKECVFTIDPRTARDLDDALSVRSLGDGMYEVGVHIADVSYFLKPDTELDTLAASRATSVYLVHKVIPMLPRILCEELCSLNPAKDRLTFSVVWKISETGDIEDEWFGRSVISSCVKLSYDHAQGFIEQPDKEWTPEQLPPLSGGFTVEDIKSRTLILDKIAKNLRKKRFDNGALRLDKAKIHYTLDTETGLPIGFSTEVMKDSNRLVEEFMLLANMAVAHRINAMYPEKALLRHHQAPKEHLLQKLSDSLKGAGVEIRTDTAGNLQKSLLGFKNDEESRGLLKVLTLLCLKQMQAAMYFCTGTIDDEENYRHYALNVPLYTHFTSPIRRYADVMVHRLLAASLGYCEEPDKSVAQIQKQANNCNDKRLSSKKVSDLSIDLFFAVFIQSVGPIQAKGMVTAVMDNCFEVLLLNIGIIKRVYLNKLPIKKEYSEANSSPTLTLSWLAKNIKQEIKMLSMIDCTIAPRDVPLRWEVKLYPPKAVGTEEEEFRTELTVGELHEPLEPDDILPTFPAKFQRSEDAEGQFINEPLEDEILDESNLDEQEEDEIVDEPHQSESRENELLDEPQESEDEMVDEQMEDEVLDEPTLDEIVDEQPHLGESDDELLHEPHHVEDRKDELLDEQVPEPFQDDDELLDEALKVKESADELPDEPANGGTQG